MNNLEDFRDFVTTRAQVIARAHKLDARVSIGCEYDVVVGETAFFLVEFLRNGVVVAGASMDGESFEDCEGAIPELGRMVDLECAFTLHEVLTQRATA